MSRPVRCGSSLGVLWADAVRAVDPPQVSPRSWCPPITLVTPAYPFSVKPPYRLTVARRLTRSLEIIAIFEQRGHQLEGRPGSSTKRSSKNYPRVSNSIQIQNSRWPKVTIESGASPIPPDTLSARFVCVQKDPSPKCWGLFYAAFNLTKQGAVRQPDGCRPRTRHVLGTRQSRWLRTADGFAVSELAI